MAASLSKEVAAELPVIRLYKDGTVERLVGSPYVPPSPEDPVTGVSSKDITISPHVSARLHLPKLTTSSSAQKLPIVVYYHGGGFCIGSAFSLFQHRYQNAIASQANALIVSVEYRLVPENPLPAPYEDSWVALRWVAAHSSANPAAAVETEQWVAEHGDFSRLFIGGDSAGANIAHNIAMRAGSEELPCGVKISGVILGQPYFWGSEAIGSESALSSDQRSVLAKYWEVAYPSAPGGVDNPMVNPFAGDAPGLAGLGCRRLLVCVAGKDSLRERGVRYYAAVKESGWRGEIEELFEVEDEDHGFYIYNCDTENGKRMVKRVASFISQ